MMTDEAILSAFELAEPTPPALYWDGHLGRYEVRTGRQDPGTLAQLALHNKLYRTWRGGALAAIGQLRPTGAPYCDHERTHTEVLVRTHCADCGKAWEEPLMALVTRTTGAETTKEG